MKDAIPPKPAPHVDPLMECAANATVMSDEAFQEMKAYYEKATLEHCGPELAAAELKFGD